MTDRPDSRSPAAPSLLVRITLSMIAVILVVFAFHALYVYSTQRTEIVNAMHSDVNESLERLSRNIAPFIEAYAVNEYEQLVATETALTQHFAVVVEDYEMAEITGTSYVSGRVSDGQGSYLPYREEDPGLNERLQQAFYSDRRPILAADGEVLGQVSVYASDERLVQKLDQVLLEELLTILVLGLALSGALIVVLRRYLLRSINYIDTAIRNRESDGIPRQRMPKIRYREIAVLSDTINTMLDAIREAKERRKIERLRLENAITGTRAATWEWNVHSGETVFNERWAEIIGYSLSELEPVSIETWMKFTHPDDLQHSTDLLEKHFRGELPYYECEARMKHKSGHWVWVLDRGRVASWTDEGEPLMMYGTHQDITPRKEAEEKLSMAAGVFRYAREGIVLTSADGIVLDVNAAFTKLTGYSRNEVVDRSYTSLTSGLESEGFWVDISGTLQSEGVWSGEWWVPRRDGSRFPALMTIADVRSESGEMTHFVTLLADISHLKKNEEKLRQIAHYDGLTGLPNRILLTDRLRQAITLARRRKEVLAVVFLDLDGFKLVNDTLGHAAGDELLVALAERMRGVLRECDTVARLGGDEFVALLPGLVQGPEDARPILDRLLAALSTGVRVGGEWVHVSASMGVALYPQDPDVDADILLRQADMAMYQAKQQGKNHYRFYHDVHEGTDETSRSLILSDNNVAIPADSDEG
ncbi:PAS domain S-box-containing protein/diguanylate cyclase (GGDEF) domain-containing protein [Marinobacter segnicrescens]|uniref:PAS domain S-box-containing protein/diguanylate cyclase (GGDEF) domain-containing protein n=1 Tax=Marinobacter segnicrescens TaxID=430453 RepID=A0A1H9ZZW6_9GAMM|nr:sensor domain-containing diguanylate cyclase [Marinobacter segnicrescens]SES86930.1 PAS domain S-box-containing protein/diguanylate cyclase (GGDEF) domain-containing protein [Marinobacter segnicrescens]